MLPNEIDPKTITSKLNQILELKLYEMQKSLMNKKSAFIGSFNIDSEPKNILNPEMLENIKKNFTFEFNEETNKIDVTSKFNVEEE